MFFVSIFVKSAFARFFTWYTGRGGKWKGGNIEPRGRKDLPVVSRQIKGDKGKKTGETTGSLETLSRGQGKNRKRQGGRRKGVKGISPGRQNQWSNKKAEFAHSR